MNAALYSCRRYYADHPMCQTRDGPDVFVLELITAKPIASESDTDEDAEKVEGRLADAKPSIPT